jgi:PHP domain
MATTRHAGRWTLEDRFASAWHYLPVEVGQGACALRAELEYERSGAVIDLGCFGPSGFRGWSGGSRRSFVIGPDAATPGYLPGELEPGVWHVAIGLYRLPLAGAEYRLTVDVSATPGELEPEAPPEPMPPPADRPPRRTLPASPGRRWLSGDLHTHTVHSDGKLTVTELASFAVSRGLDFLAITDHNTISHHAELPAAGRSHGIVLLPGQEVTTDAGHANAFGDIGWIDFREPADEWLAACERAGGLLSVNHPIGGHVSWVAPMKRRPPLVEIWHWSWLDTRWTTPLAWWLAWDPSAIPVGGCDWHVQGNDAPPGSPTTWVEADAEDPDAVLEAMRSGRTAITASRDGPALLRLGDEFVACDADGLILTGPEGPKARVSGDLARFRAADGCHRLIDPGGATQALTGRRT